MDMDEAASRLPLAFVLGAALLSDVLYRANAAVC